MAYISFQPKDFFDTSLYTGTGAELAITGVGFQPDLVWAKNRDSTESHNLFDAPRGATKYWMMNNSDGETTNAQSLKSFDSDGFTLGTFDGSNKNTEDYVVYNWKAGTTSGLTGGTITPTAYSINTTSGFGIYHYNCTGANATIAHGLPSAPKMVITKSLGDSSASAVWHTGIGATKYLVSSTTAAEATNANAWNSTIPTDTLISLGTDGQTNGTGKNNVMYAFCDVPGYSKMGTFAGNGSATNGPFVYTGFRPAFVLVKVLNYTAAWNLFDNKRVGYNPTNKVFTPNTSGAEAAAWMSDIYSNGFKPFSTDPQINGTYNYMYMAFADQPIVSSNDVPGVAR